MELRGLRTLRQQQVKNDYKGFVFQEELKFDRLVEGVLLMELKAVQEVLPIHKAQLLSYMKLLDVPFGLVMNFHELKIVDGTFTMMLPGANRD